MPEPFPYKHIWVEIEYYLDDSENFGTFAYPVSPNYPNDLTGNQKAMESDGEWHRDNFWFELQPNPPEERIFVWVGRSPGASGTGTIFIDSIHVATECIPEPATLTLFGAGMLGLGAWRKRKKARK